MDNDIKIALLSLGEIFEKISVISLLRNGNAEKQLKFLTMCTLDDFPDFAYVMDKLFEGHEIDLLTYQNKKPLSAAGLYR